MRIAHLIVSGAAFAVWLTAVVVYCVVCNNSVTDNWYLYGPGAVLPSFWCVYAWFASRRAAAATSRWLTILAVPVLVMGLGILFVAVTDAMAELPVEERAHPNGMGVAMVGGCCWELAVPCGLISFIWAVVLQVKRLSQPPKEP